MKVAEEDFENLFSYIRRYGKFISQEDVINKDTPSSGIIGNNCKYIYDEILKTEIYAYRDPMDNKYESICFNNEKHYVSLSKNDIGYYVHPDFEHLFINAKNARKNLIMIIRS